MRARKLLVASIGVATITYCGGKTVVVPPPDASTDAAQDSPVFSVDAATPKDAPVTVFDGLVANLAPPPADD